MTFAILSKPIQGLLCSIAILLAVAASGLAKDIYSVAGVPVDVTAESAIKAREEAVLIGQREGLRILLQRLTTPDFFSRLPDVGSIELAPLVRSFGVENEQLAANRYVAEVMAVFDGNGIQRLLQGRGIPIVLGASPPLLVVPARRVEGDLTFFDESDPFISAWAKGFDRNTLLDVVLPVGDLLDVTKLRPGATSEELSAGLATMAARYGTQSAVLIAAEGEPGGQIRIERLANHGWGYIFSSFALNGEDERVWDQAVAGSLVRLETPWKAESLVRFDNAETLTISAPLGDVSDWARISKTLGGLPEVRKVSLAAFSQSHAVLRVSYIGGLPQLQRSLQNRGLQLADEAGQWRLR